MSGSLLGDLAATLYLVAFEAGGLLVASRQFAREKAVVRLWLGLVVGLVGMMCLPVLWAFLLDFTLWAQLAGLVTMAAGIGAYLLIARDKASPRFSPSAATPGPAPARTSSAPDSDPARADLAAPRAPARMADASASLSPDPAASSPPAFRADKPEGGSGDRPPFAPDGPAEPPSDDPASPASAQGVSEGFSDPGASPDGPTAPFSPSPPTRVARRARRKGACSRLVGGRLLLCSLLALAFCSALLYTHVLHPVDGAYHTGQSGYGDMSMHLGFITSFAVQKTFPFVYSIEPGVRVGYPFLCDSISATLYQLGAHLPFSYVLPMLPALFCVFLGFGLLMERWLRSERKAVLAFFLFFVGGGFGFWYFVDQLKANPGQFLGIFTGYYTTPTNDVTRNVKWVNPIADMLIPQRATLFGWMVLLAALYLLYRLFTEKETRHLWALGLLGGAMPLIHTHSFLALGLLSAAAWLHTFLDEPRQALRWWPYVALAAALSLPQLLGFTFRQAESGSFLTLQRNWANESDNVLWFYIKNMGLVFVLGLPAVLACKRERTWFLLSLPIWLIAEFVVFQPNAYDNNKLIFIPYLLLCGLVASFLTDVYDRMKGMGGRRVLAAIAVVIMTLSGALTLVREAVSDYELFGTEAVRLAEYVGEELEPDAVILTAEYHNNAIAALTGRSIVQGAATFLHFHGVYDSARYQDIWRMYNEPGALSDLRDKYGINYALLSSYERSLGGSEYLFQGYEEVYRDGGTVLYKVS